LGLFPRGLTVKECTDTFKGLIKEFLQGQTVHNPRTLTEHCRRILRCAVYDGIYEVQNLETALIALFGHETLMIESKSNTKVAVTATSNKLPSARLFTNYNGPDLPQQDSGKKIQFVFGVSYAEGG
jgi:hypothetical protein